MHKVSKPKTRVCKINEFQIDSDQRCSSAQTAHIRHWDMGEKDYFTFLQTFDKHLNKILKTLNTSAERVSNISQGFLSNILHMKKCSKFLFKEIKKII